jgi:hypothetical protein
VSAVGRHASRELVSLWKFHNEFQDSVGVGGCAGARWIGGIFQAQKSQLALAWVMGFFRHKKAGLRRLKKEGEPKPPSVII